MSKPTFESEYDYQYGYCHFFANSIINELRKMLPNERINYYLILATRYDDNGDNIDDVLVHAYIKIGSYYLDSNGFNKKDSVDKREKEWDNKEEELTPKGYSFESWQEEADFIPEYFFNRYCKVGKVKEDIKKFISNPEFKQFIKKIKDKDKDPDAKYITCRNCRKKFTQTTHKGKKSLPICPNCGTHN